MTVSREDLALELIALASLVTKEGEGMDLADLDMSLEDIVRMRSMLSGWRSSIDGINKALAKKWDIEHGNAVYDDEFTRWFLSRPKGKRALDADLFYEWLATKDAEELKKLVPVRSIKVSGMSQAERTTLLNEEPTSQDVVIQNKPI